jgi:hypothetical protein
MNRTAATHATHDEMLLARLYGGDVDEGERGRALDQMASCQECADAFADFGVIAAATAALPTPPRPRNFTLTEVDAARFGRRSNSWAILHLLARTKALGGSMVAAGLVGVALVGAISVFGPGGGGGVLDGLTAKAAPVNGAGAPGPAGGASSPALDQNSAGGMRLGAAPAATAAASVAGLQPVPQPSAASTGQPPQAASEVTSGPTSIPTALPLGSGAAAFGPGNGAQGGVTGGFSSVAPSTGSGGNSLPARGPDARDIALAAFAALTILGALTLAVPRLAARRARR